MYKKKILLLVLILSYFSFNVKGQSGNDLNYETWWGLMSSTRISKRLSIYNDFHYSNNLFVAYRTGVTYHPKSDNFITTVAYAYLKLTTPFTGGELTRSEHRPWLQIIYRIPTTKRFSLSFRFKYDARFIRDLNSESFADSYSFNHRWRFNNSLRYDFSTIGSAFSYFGVILNEALITTGPGPNGANYEHRTHFLGEVRHGNFIFSAGYMIRYLAFGNNSSRWTHGPIFWLTINLNVTKDKMPTFYDEPEDH